MGTTNRCLTIHRCHRLRKECTTPAPVPRKRHRNKSTRVAQLEERLDTLTNLLTSARGSTDALDLPVSAALPTPSVSSATTQDGGPPSSELSTVLGDDRWVKAFCRPKEIAEPDTSIFRASLASVLEEKLFSDFRTEMNQFFPFVMIPPQATAADYRKEKPFLFRSCIAAAFHRDPILQREISEELLRYIGERMLMKAERSMDLLQGILVLLAWYVRECASCCPLWCHHFRWYT